MVDDNLCNEVIRAAYGLAKGRAGVPVKASSIANGTGMDPTDVARAVELLAHEGRVTPAPAPAPEQFALSRFGVELAKSHVELEAGVVFVDER